MTTRRYLSANIRLRFTVVLCVAAGLLPIMVRRAAAQAVSPGNYPIRDRQPVDQALPSQQLGTDLTLNQGVQSITAENESFHHFGIGLAAAGGVVTNFFGTETNPTTTAAAQFSAEPAFRLASERTQYFLSYMPQYSLYPEYSEANDYSQRAYQILTHDISERSAAAWTLTAARYLSLNQFLPQNLNVGGIGVVAPTLGQTLRADSFEVTNAATAVRLRHLVSTRVTLTGTLTGGYFLTVPVDIAHQGSGIIQRFIATGIDLRMDYAWRPRDQFGIELTPLYIEGLQPGGHIISEAVQGTYEHQVNAKLRARVAAGPLFVQGSSRASGSIHNTSYAINASLLRQIRQSEFSVSFNRAFVVNLLSPALLSNGLNASAYLPTGKNWIFTGAGSYFHDTGTGTYGTANIYGAQAQVAYQLSHPVQLFARYTVTSNNFDREGSIPSYSFVRNQVLGGIRFNLGNPTTPGGVQ